jgi:hypothetical protein
MMRFPLRLTADLVKARIARKLRLGRGLPSVRFVDAAEILLSDSNHPISHEKIREITDSGSPAVWIGGGEPLQHPGIAHLVRAIAQSGHFVFLETDGAALRRRIHEFQPVSRLFLTVRMDPSAPGRVSGGAQASASELAVEGIRAAKLSGFSICFCVYITADTNLNETAELFDLAQSLDVDGIVVSSSASDANSLHPSAEALMRNTVEARKLVGSMWWESFSRLVEPITSGDRCVMLGGNHPSELLEQEAHANDGGVRVV